MSFNYTNPSVEAYLETKAKKRISLTAWDSKYWLRPEAGSVADFFAQFRTSYPVLVSAQAKVLLGTANTVSANLAMPQNVFEYLVEQNLDLFQVGGNLILSFGYGQSRTRQFSGVVSFPKVSFQDSQFVQISLEGTGAMWFASRIETDLARKGVKTDSWTCLQVLEQICESHVCQLFTMNERGEEVPLLAGAVPPEYQNLKKQISYKPTMGKDFQLLKEVIARTANYGFYMSGNKLVIYNPKVASGAREIPLFEYRGRTLPQQGIYPAMSVTIENSEIAFPLAARKLSSSDIDPSSKVLKKVEVTNADKDINLPHTKPYGLSETQGGLGEQITADKGHTIPMAADDPTLKEKLLSEKQESLQLAGLRVSLETLGNPYLNPGQMMKVRGVTALYNGTYYIQEVTHSFDSGGYKTSLQGFTVGVGTSAASLLDEYGGIGVPESGESVFPPTADRVTATVRED